MTGSEAQVALDRLVDQLIATEGVSAASALVATPHRVLWERSAGRRRVTAEATSRGSSRGRAVQPSDLFDLASLTKPWISTLALGLDREGALPLVTELGEIWPRVDPGWAAADLRALLCHRARLAAWTPLYRRCRSRASVPDLLLRGGLPAARRGTYSDLGFILWGLTAERALGRSLDDLFGERLGRPIAESIGFRPAPGRAVECRLDNGREVSLAAAQGVRVAPHPGPAPGRPQDGNARFLEDVAGHAGLFGTARSLWRLGREWLAPGDLLRPRPVREALSGNGRFQFGWMRRTLRGSAGPGLSRRAFGHTGFTGGSLWIDPASRRVFVLLLHRTRVSFDPAPWRRRFHRLAAGL